MLAEKNKTYALLDSNNSVMQIFTQKDIKEWNENQVKVVEIPKSDVEWVEIGIGYDVEKNAFVRPSLAEAQQMQIEYVNTRFEAEIAQIQAELIPSTELATWDLQAQEAQNYLINKMENNAPLLKILATGRGESMEALARKILQKSQEYRNKLFALIAYRQTLRDSIESATTYEAIADVEYHSPYGFK